MPRSVSCLPIWQFCGKIPAPFLPRAKAVFVQENPVYRFADCELDPVEHRLSAHGQSVTLTPKVFETLVLLVERAGHVVSKDELMAALWPRGFVHESNLTKHIWLIRRALGDGEDESRFIETVPKLGYRFVAPVQQVARTETPYENAVEARSDLSGFAESRSGWTPSADNGIVAGHPWVAGRDPERRHHGITRAGDGEIRAPDKLAAVPVIGRADRMWLTAFGLIMVALVGGWYWWRGELNARKGSTPAPDPAAVAIVDFNNLSGNAKDAWLGPALEQMLATELAANGKLHAVSEELVRPARADLPAPSAGGYAPASLATLQQRLGAHYVLSGSYLVSGPVDTPQLRVDLTVQDTPTGKAFASLSRSTAVNNLPNLVAQVGGDLRDRFGEAPSSPALLKQIAAAQPPTEEVARHVGFALDALHKYDPARARDELLQAIAQSPGYAPAYLYLSQAWSMLGYRAKAVAAAKQAAQNDADLSHEQQLLIRARQAALGGDKIKLSEVRGELVTLRPQDTGYRLHWIAALVAAGKYDDASAALAALRKLPGTAGDPRVELAAVQIASARGDNAATIPHARAALRKAQARDATGLVAEAELQLGIALDQDAQAEPSLRKAIADYRRIGNPHGEALAWQNLGNLQDARNQIALARETYQRAMTIYQGIGDLGGEAAIYDDLSRMLWAAGDRDGTEAALRQALRIGRETNDPVRQAWSLTGLATVLLDESASDEVAAIYREAIALDSQSNNRLHLAFALATYADLLRMRGQLDQAHEICMQAQTTAAAVADASLKMSADFECAQIDLDRGNADAAATAFAAIEKQAIAAKDTFNASNAQLVLGQIAMGRGHWGAARDVLQQSLTGWTASKEAAGEATSQALLALCDAALVDATARDRAAASARDLRGQVTARAEVFPLDIALAELQGITGDPVAALTRLRTLADDATKRHWIGLAFEARLAAQHVLDHGADRSAANAARSALAADALKAGYGWIDQRLAMAQAPPTR